MRRTLVGLALVASLATCSGPDYAQVCHTPAEDTPPTCQLDPSARYDYDRGAWRQVDQDMRYPNGNRPPTGAEVMSHPFTG